MNLRNMGFKNTFDKFLKQNFTKVMNLLQDWQEGPSVNLKLVKGQ